MRGNFQVLKFPLVVHLHILFPGASCQTADRSICPRGKSAMRGLLPTDHQSQEGALPVCGHLLQSFLLLALANNVKFST